MIKTESIRQATHKHAPEHCQAWRDDREPMVLLTRLTFQQTLRPSTKYLDRNSSILSNRHSGESRYAENVPCGWIPAKSLPERRNLQLPGMLNNFWPGTQNLINHQDEGPSTIPTPLEVAGFYFSGASLESARRAA